MDFELSEEQKMIQSLARDFVAEQLKPLERDILGRAADLSDARAVLSADKEAALVKMAQDMGLWSIGVPEELGGGGLDTLSTCLVEEEMAQTIVPFHCGDVSPILYECNEAQREQFLAPALSGKKQVYLGLVEPSPEGDAAGMAMTAGRDGEEYVLNGRKLAFSRAAGDYFAVVIARTPEGISCFLVDRDTPGFSVTGAEQPEGWMAGIPEPPELVFENCRVPVENLLGEEGAAFSLGRDWLPRRRIVRGARNIGVARRLLEEAAVQAQSFVSYGKSVNLRTGIQAALADIAVLIHTAALTVYEAAWKADIGKPVTQAAGVVKLATTQMLHTVADRVSHIFNGPPFVKGLPMQRLCRRVKEEEMMEHVLDRQRSIIAGEVLKGVRI